MATSPTLPLVHFHIRGPETEILDQDGSRHADLSAVNAALIAGARDLLGHDLLEGRALDLRCRIDAETDGAVVATLAFKNAIIIRT